eukprot:6048948-Heterocapsa_arctica.AAC.1
MLNVRGVGHQEVEIEDVLEPELGVRVQLLPPELHTRSVGMVLEEVVVGLPDQEGLRAEDIEVRKEFRTPHLDIAWDVSPRDVRMECELELAAPLVQVARGAKVWLHRPELEEDLETRRGVQCRLAG